jgi:hypothetical protein
MQKRLAIPQNSVVPGGAEVEPKTHHTLREFRRALQQVVPSIGAEISLSARLDSLVPSSERRRAWQELQAAGWELPELQRRTGVFAISALLVFAPVVLLALSLRTWSVVLSLIELSWVAHRLTRPLAVHPPIGCETVRELVLGWTPFRHEDYRAGLWPQEEIAAKVRLIISRAAGVPFADIKNDTKLLVEL